MKFFRSLRSHRHQRQQPPPVSRAEALASIPHIVPAVSWQIQESGEVLIEYPLTLKPLLRAIFSRFNSNSAENLSRKLQLDGLGSRVWLAIDGHRDVGAIISAFAAATAITRQEAEASVSSFLRELGKRGLIVLREPGLRPEIEPQ